MTRGGDACGAVMRAARLASRVGSFLHASPTAADCRGGDFTRNLPPQPFSARIRRHDHEREQRHDPA